MLPFAVMLYRRVGAAVAAIANGASWSVSAENTGAAAQATFTANPDGSCSPGGAGSLSISITNWRVPTASGAGDTVWIEFTLSSGTTPQTGTLGSRQQLNAARTVGLSRPVNGTNSCVLVVKFYDAASGGNLLGTNTLTLTAFRDAGV